MSQLDMQFVDEADAFMMQGARPGVQWSIVRYRRLLWTAIMLYQGREVCWTSIDHSPEPGDEHLTESERRYFHDHAG